MAIASSSEGTFSSSNIVSYAVAIEWHIKQCFGPHFALGRPLGRENPHNLVGMKNRLIRNHDE